MTEPDDPIAEMFQRLADNAEGTIDHPVYGRIFPFEGAPQGVKETPDGRHLMVVLLLHDYAAVTVSDPDSFFRDEYWRYDSIGAAISAAQEWDGKGEPSEVGRTP